MECSPFAGILRNWKLPTDVANGCLWSDWFPVTPT